MKQKAHNLLKNIYIVLIFLFEVKYLDLIGCQIFLFISTLPFKVSLSRVTKLLISEKGNFVSLL